MSSLSKDDKINAYVQLLRESELHKSIILELNSTIESKDKEISELKVIIENLENQNEIKSTKIIQKEVEEGDLESYLEEGWKEVLEVNHSKTIIEKEVSMDEFP